MAGDPACVHTDFGAITIGHELPDTVTFAVDDRTGMQRVLVLQIDQAFQVIDAVVTGEAAVAGEPVRVHTDFGTITVGREVPEAVSFAVDDRIGAQRVLVLRIGQAYQVVDAMRNAIRCAITDPFAWSPSE